MPMEMAEGILLTIVTAATPLLFAALGELVAERSGVLNLGVEGMMAVGAVMGFAGGHVTGMPVVGVLAGIIAGAAMGGLFGIVTLVFAANQNASGLALTLFGLGLSGLIGDSFTGMPGLGMAQVHIPGSVRPAGGRLGDLRRGSAGLSRRRADHRRLVVPVPHQRRADPALGRRQPHSAHALGYPVLRVRLLAVLVRRRLRRRRRRLSVAGLYAAMDPGDDRRPRLDRDRAGGVRHLAAGTYRHRRRSCSAPSISCSCTPRRSASASRRSSCRCCLT